MKQGFFYLRQIMQKFKAADDRFNDDLFMRYEKTHISMIRNVF